MARKSAFSTYKSSIKRDLIRTYGWDSKVALDWLNNNIEYLRDTFRTAPFSETAYFINKKANSGH